MSDQTDQHQPPPEPPRPLSAWPEETPRDAPMYIKPEFTELRPPKPPRPRWLTPLIIGVIVVVAGTAASSVMQSSSPRNQLTGTWVFDSCSATGSSCTFTFFKDGTAELSGKGANYSWQDDTHIKIDETGLVQHHEIAEVHIVNDKALHITFNPDANSTTYTPMHRQGEAAPTLAPGEHFITVTPST